jgi:hypothetical protein
MKSGQRRSIRTAIALAMVVAGPTTALAPAVVMSPFGQSSDCETVQAMSRYNKHFTDGIDQAFEDDPDEPPSIQHYRNRAAELHNYAVAIREENLRANAEAVADAADQFVELMPALQAELGSTTDSEIGLSPVVQKLNTIAHESYDAAVALAESCGT